MPACDLNEQRAEPSRGPLKVKYELDHVLAVFFCPLKPINRVTEEECLGCK